MNLGAGTAEVAAVAAEVVAAGGPALCCDQASAHAAQGSEGGDADLSHQAPSLMAAARDTTWRFDRSAEQRQEIELLPRGQLHADSLPLSPVTEPQKQNRQRHIDVISSTLQHETSDGRWKRADGRWLSCHI